MKKSNLKTTAIAAFALLSLLGSRFAMAVSTVSNLSNAAVLETGLFTGYFPEEGGAEVRVAMPFVTGSLGSTLNSVDLNIEGTTGTAPIIVSIFGDSATQPGEFPGSALEVLSGASSPSLNQIYSYTSSGTSLSASSRYWLVLSTANTGTLDTSYFWHVTEDASEISPAGWTIGNGPAAYSSLDGEWIGVTELASTNSGMFAVNATLVPEPTALGLLGLGSLVALRRRRHA